MQLALKEITYLAEMLGDYNHLSPFYNIKEELDGTELDKLTEKEIISEGEIVPETRESISVLARPDCASSILLISGYARMKLYSYKKGAEVYLAENVDGDQLRISKPETWDKALYKFSEFIGTSSLLNVSIKVTLSEQEIVVLSAIVDLYRKNALAGYIDEATPLKNLSLSAIKEELSSGYKNGLLRLVAANYDLKISDYGSVESVLDSLITKECLTKEGDGYILTTRYVLFARNYLIPHTQLLLETFRILDEENIASGRYLAIASSLHDILGLFYDGKNFELETINAFYLLNLIESYLSGPVLEEPDGAKVGAGQDVQPVPPMSPTASPITSDPAAQPPPSPPPPAPPKPAPAPQLRPSPAPQPPPPASPPSSASAGPAPTASPPPSPAPASPAPASRRFCRHCGKSLSPNAAFCRHCGFKLKED